MENTNVNHKENNEVLNLVLGLIPVVGIYFAFKNFKSKAWVIIILTVLEILYQVKVILFILALLFLVPFSSIGSGIDGETVIAESNTVETPVEVINISK